MIKLFFALPFLALATPAAAIECEPAEKVVADYKAEFGETIDWIGVSGTGAADLLILTGPDGNWSAFFVNEDVACLIGYGLQNLSFPKANV